MSVPPSARRISTVSPSTTSETVTDVELVLSSSVLREFSVVPSLSDSSVSESSYVRVKKTLVR